MIPPFFLISSAKGLFSLGYISWKDGVLTIAIVFPPASIAP